MQIRIEITETYGKQSQYRSRNNGTPQIVNQRGMPPHRQDAQQWDFLLRARQRRQLRRISGEGFLAITGSNISSLMPCNGVLRPPAEGSITWWEANSPRTRLPPSVCGGALGATGFPVPLQ